MHARRRSTVIAASIAAILASAFAAPTGTSVALTGHGGIPDGSVFTAVALTPDSFLVGAEGPDSAAQTADDQILLVTNLGGVPVVTTLATPYRPDYSGSITRLSATRAIVSSLGPDNTARTADDALLLLDQLGSGNVVTTITVGSLQDNDSAAPVRLDASTVAVISQGPDFTHNTADDLILILSDLGGTNTVTPVAAPRIRQSGRSRATVLTPTSFLVGANGTDGSAGTADDLLYLVTGVGGVPVRTDIPVPGLEDTSTNRPVRLSATSALVSTSGADSTQSNTDDSVAILTGLGTTNTVTLLVIGSIYNYANGRPLVLGPGTAVVGSPGPDNTDRNTDDRLAVLTGLDTATPAVAYATVGCMDEDFGSRAVALGGNRVACATGGVNNGFGGSDDTVAIVSDVGGANTVVQVPNAAMTTYAPAHAAAIPGGGFLIVSGGTDNTLGGTDDEVRVFSQDGEGAWSFVAVPGLGALNNIPAAPVVLGGGRAVFVSAGADNDTGQEDDLIRVITGIDGMGGALLDKASIKWDSEHAEKGESLSGSGRIDAEVLAGLGGNDITVSLGNAAQTIAAADLLEKKPGKFQYADKKGLRGWLRSLKIDAGKGKFSIKGKGVGTGADTTDAGFLAVSLDPNVENDAPFGDVVVATETAKGLSWKRPQE